MDANHNIIEVAKLTTENLISLDLSYNRLKKFPDVGKLAVLKTINISHNLIIAIEDNDIK